MPGTIWYMQVYIKHVQCNFQGLTSGYWDAGDLIGAALFHLNVAKVEDASHSTEEGHLLIFLHSKNIHSILGEGEREGGEITRNRIEHYFGVA